MAATRPETGEMKTVRSDDSGGAGVGSLDGRVRQPAEPASVAPPPPPVSMADASKTEADEKKPADDKLREKDNEITLAGRKETEDRRNSRDLPAAAAKAGPARSGPLQTQSNQVGKQAFEMPVTRVVGGKTFNNRNGAWYDTAYHGQGTTYVRRGTNEFKKLDGGLKSIANKLSGVVVVVWKDKAFRIQ